MEPRPDDTLIVHQSKGRTLLLVALAAGFVALGLWMAGLLGADPADDRPGGKLHAIALATGLSDRAVVHGFGWIAALFFGACGIAGVAMLFRTGPVLLAGPSGIWWRSLGGERVPWDQFTALRERRVQRVRFLDAMLREPDRWPSRMRRANRAFGYGDVSYTVQATDASFDDLAAAFARYRPDLPG